MFESKNIEMVNIELTSQLEKYIQRFGVGFLSGYSDFVFVTHSSLNLLTELVIKLLSFSFQNCYLKIRCFFRLAVVEQMVCQVN